MVARRPLNKMAKLFLVIFLGLAMVCGLLILFTGQVSPVTAAPLTTAISGDITADTTWTVAGSPYTVTGIVSVINGAKLTIEPGVEVRFLPEAQLRILGSSQLEAIGTPTTLINFTSNLASPAPGDWNGIFFNITGLATNTIQYAVIEYAKFGVELDSSVVGARFDILNNTFRYIGDGSLNNGAIIGSPDNSALSYNTIYSSTAGILVNEIGSTVIQDNHIYDIDETCIGLESTGAPSSRNTLLNNQIHDCGSQGIFIDGGLSYGSNNQVIGNTIWNTNEEGLRVLNQDIFEFRLNTVHDTALASTTSSAVLLYDVDAATLQDNYLFDNGSTGSYEGALRIYNSLGGPDLPIVLTGTRLKDSNGSGFVFAGINNFSGQTIHSNAICVVDRYEIENQSSALTLNAPGNWYGTNFPVIGTEIAGAVIFTPFIQLSATVSPTILPADGLSTAVITVTMNDGAGHTMPNGARQVNLSTDLGTLAETVLTLDSNGVATTTLTSTTPGTATITVTEWCGYPVTVTVEFQATDVAVSKSTAQSEITLGQTITYTIQYSNNSDVAATNVVITDTLPPGTSWVTDTAESAGFSRAFAGQDIVWTRASLGGNTAGTITLVARLLQTATGACGLQLTNSVVITTATLDSDPTNNRASDGSGVHVICADVTLTKIGPTGNIAPGDTITYTLYYTNAGTAPAANVVITDVHPITGGVDTLLSGIILNPGQGGSVVYPVWVDPAICISDPTVTITNTGFIGTTSPESNALNNDSSFSNVVQCLPDLVITKTRINTATSLGKVITFTLEYANTGVYTAPGVVLTDVLPAGVSYVTDTSTLVPVTTANTVAWSLGDLGPGASGSFAVGLVADTLTCTGANVSYTNTVQIDSTRLDANPANNTDIESSGLIPCNNVDLVVVKNDGVGGPTERPFVWAGDIITYTIAYVNTGGEPATGVVLTETLPAYTTFVGPTGPAGWYQVCTTSRYTYNLGTVGARSGNRLNFVVRVVPSLPTTVTVVNNEVRIGGNEADAYPDDNVSYEQTPVQATADLVVEKSALTPVTYPGASATYIITVTNQGSVTASNVLITDTLPTGTTYESNTVIGSPVSSTGNRVVWHLSQLDPGQSISFSLTVRVDNDPGLCTGSYLVNTVEVRSDTPEGDYSNNSASTTAANSPVLACRDVAITKTPDDPQTTLNRDVVFTLSYGNPGLITATNVMITDVLPIGISFGQSTPVHSGPYNRVYQWNVGDLSPGMTGTVVITGRVSSDAAYCGQTLTNTAGITASFASGDDEYLNNNQAIATVTVLCIPDLAIVKNDQVGGPTEPPFVQPGDVFTYSIIYSNIGVGAASGVVITETLPNHTTFVGPVGPNGWFQVDATNQYTYYLGTVNAGAGFQIDFAVQVVSLPPGGFITNTVCIGGLDDEVTLRNNCSFEQTLVTTNTARLNVTKRAIPPSGSPVSPGDTITYTVVVRNDGSAPASDILISDTLPLGEVTFVTATLSNGNPVYGPNPLTATVASLSVNEAVTMTVKVTVNNVPAGSIITNTAQAVADTLPVQLSLPVTHVVTSTTVPTSNLVISKSAVPPTGSWVEPGERITYTITIVNNGSSAQDNVVVSDLLDTYVTLVTSHTTAGTLSGPNPVQVSIPTLAAGETVIVTLGVMVTGNISGTWIINQASVTSAQTPSPQVSEEVIHVISSSLVIPPSFNLTKSADPPSGTPVAQGDTITYTIVVSNSGGPATNVVLSDDIPAGTAYVSGTVATTLGTPSFDGTRIIVSAPYFPPFGLMTTTFRVTVTTNLTTTITNIARLISSQTAMTSSNVVTHPVRGTGGPLNVYLPIILKNFSYQSAAMSWVDQSQDRVREVDGSDSQAFSPDGQNDGAFLVTVNMGSEGPKTIDHVRLVSTQSAEWDTIINTVPVLGIFDGGVRLNNADGTINQVVDGQVIVTIFASDDASGTRFPPDTYDYTVTITFTDGSWVSATARIPALPSPPPSYCDPVADITVGNTPRGVTVDATRNRVYVANYGSSSVSVIDSNSNTVITTITGITTANGIAFQEDPTNPIIWATNYSSDQVTPIQADAGANNFTVLDPVPVGDGPWGVAYDPVHNYVYVVNNSGNSVTVIDAGAQTVETTIRDSFNQPYHLAANPVTGRVYVANFGDHTVTVLEDTAVSSVVDLAVGDPSTQPYGVAVDEWRNVVYVATVDSHRVVAIGTLQGQPDQLLGWAAFHRGYFAPEPHRPVPMRAIAVNPDIGSIPPNMDDGGHVWTTTASSDGSEANQALLIPKGWISYFHSPVPCNVGINPTEGIAINRVLDRAYVTSGTNPGVLQVFTDDPTPPLVPFEMDRDTIWLEIFTAE